MKTIKYIALFLIICYSKVYGQKHVETIHKEVTFKNNSNENTFIARNINGGITLEAYDGNTLKIEIKKTISANTQAHLEKGKQEFKVKIVEKESKVILHPEASYICFDKEYGGMNVNMGHHGKKEVPYDFELEYIIKVPKSVNIDVSTINKGNISVNNIKAKRLKASNINGSIMLHNISGATEAHTINGTIDVTYAKNPNKKSSYSTINGDITIHYLKDLTADVAFESMHGELYTNFAISDHIAKAEKRISKKKGLKYSYKSTPLVRIGNGGPRFDFKTLNGDVSIKKI